MRLLFDFGNQMAVCNVKTQQLYLDSLILFYSPKYTISSSSHWTHGLDNVTVRLLDVKCKTGYCIFTRLTELMLRFVVFSVF